MRYRVEVSHGDTFIVSRSQEASSPDEAANIVREVISYEGDYSPAELIVRVWNNDRWETVEREEAAETVKYRAWNGGLRSC
jgi:hypothetical protein